ncbi:MAG TPA: site-specific integrase [Alphaproteobacteria bacterium]|nr:site-specific integrase [Alphaproteobacteria bacterium]
MGFSPSQISLRTPRVEFIGFQRPKYSMHSLPHFFASIVLAEGNVKRAQELLGHSASRPTLDVYPHRLESPGSDAAIMERMEQKILG